MRIAYIWEDQRQSFEEMAEYLLLASTLSDQVAEIDNMLLSYLWI